jgi:hypothetical protein
MALAFWGTANARNSRISRKRGHRRSDDLCFLELGSAGAWPVLAPSLTAAIERMNICKATLAQSVPVSEMFEGKTVREGVARVRP